MNRSTRARYKREMRGTPFHTAQLLAEMFCEDERSADLHIAIFGIDKDGDLLEWPAGQWIEVEDCEDGGRTIYGIELSPFEVRARIYDFLIRIEAEITNGLIFDVEQLAKYHFLHRDKQTLKYRVRVFARSIAGGVPQ